jgi:hypothetical protein
LNPWIIIILEILPKTEKYFQKQKSTSKNTAILPNIEMYYQK